MVNQTLVQIRHRNTELEETDMILTPADRPESPDLVLDVDEPSDNTEAADSAISTTTTKHQVQRGTRQVRPYCRVS